MLVVWGGDGLFMDGCVPYFSTVFLSLPIACAALNVAYNIQGFTGSEI